MGYIMDYKKWITPMYLSSKEQKKILKLIETLGQSLDSETMRQSAGYVMLDLLQSDYLGSFAWDEKKNSFDKGVCINMSQANLLNYKNYYHKYDTITDQLMVRKSATRVNDIISQQALTKTEFYNDFLAVDGLYYGINLHVFNDNENIGDFRVWRKKGRENFDDKSVYMLNMIKPYFCNAMRNIRQHETVLSIHPELSICTERLDIHKLKLKFSLTKREAQITLEIIQGHKDDTIAIKLHIAFSTLRTHIKHIFAKLQITSRSLLIRKVLSEL
jgi:DNA-binding CsgD family transcriptional regulator